MDVLSGLIRINVIKSYPMHQGLQFVRLEVLWNIWPPSQKEPNMLGELSHAIQDPPQAELTPVCPTFIQCIKTDDPWSLGVLDLSKQFNNKFLELFLWGHSKYHPMILLFPNELDQKVAKAIIMICQLPGKCDWERFYMIAVTNAASKEE
jgi:hypothetical protein